MYSLGVLPVLAAAMERLVEVAVCLFHVFQALQCAVLHTDGDWPQHEGLFHTSQSLQCAILHT